MRVSQIFTRVSDDALNGGCGNGRRRCEINLRIGTAHPSLEISVCSGETNLAGRQNPLVRTKAWTASGIAYHRPRLRKRL